MQWSTRSDWDARPPRNIRTDVDPAGVAVHWYGAGRFGRDDHDDCLRLVRAAQDQHMADPGVNDIMYNLAACRHGYVVEARSTRAQPRVRSGANGTAAANSRWYAILALWGAGDGRPGGRLLNAIRDGIDWLRSAAGAGRALTGHRDHVSTACPGDELYAWAHAGAPRPDTEDDMPTAREIVNELLSRQIQLTEGEQARYADLPESISVRSLLVNGGGGGRCVEDLVWGAELPTRSGGVFGAGEHLAQIRQWAYDGHRARAAAEEARDVTIEALGTLGELAARMGDGDLSQLSADIADRVDRLRRRAEDHADVS